MPDDILKRRIVEVAERAQGLRQEIRALSTDTRPASLHRVLNAQQAVLDELIDIVQTVVNERVSDPSVH
jgi:hypothetical protein